jgi:two-component system response regulator FixJ
VNAETPRSAPLVFVVDDDAGVRDSVGALLSAAGYDFRLLESGKALLDALKDSRPDGILLDYAMPGLSGLEVLRLIPNGAHMVPAIMITAHGDVDLAVAAMKAGAADFIEKPWDKDALLESLSRAIALSLQKQDIITRHERAKAIIASFTPREKSVFDELIGGASNKEIARSLDISPRTVEVYRKNVLEKSSANGVAGLVRLAFAARQIKA